MIERYSYPEMKRLWELENKFRKWLEIEIYACEAWSELGRIPHEAVEKIKAGAGFDLERILEIEKTTNHDVIAFLTAVAEKVGDESKYIHMGLTSSDVGDTALCALMRDAILILIDDVEALLESLRRKAVEHKHTVMIGRTHGVQAEPMTYGLKILLWIAEMERNLERLNRAKEVVSVGKISGAVGTYANIDPRVEEYVCRKLGLTPARISTQIIQRDRHAEYLTTIAITASSLEKFATENRNLQRTEILEVQEEFRKGQKGSSAMPHKRNPITNERVAGLARVIRSNSIAAMENVPLWHERDITHSSTERIIIPDSTILLDYILRKFTDIMDNLVVFPENMMRNLELTGGLIFSQILLLNLVERGLLREEAYEYVQRNARRAWDEKRSFKELVLQDEDIKAVMGEDEILACFDYDYHLKYVDTIYKRFGL